MKAKKNKWAVLTALVLSTIVLFAFSRKASEIITVDLATAISQGKVFAELTSNGTYSGKSVKLNLRSNSSTSMKIRLPAGTIFKPSTEDEQDLILLQEEFIVLQPKSQTMNEISAYCMQASDRCPENGGKFKLGKNSNANMDKLITFLKTNSVSEEVLQDAVWAISDGNPISNINVSVPSDRELRKYLATITGRPDVWYSTPQERIVQEDRRIHHETVVVKGDISYQTTKGAMVFQEIVAADGRSIHKSEKRAATYGGKVDFTFTLKVRGWEKGDYAVKVKEGTKELANYPFSI